MNSNDISSLSYKELQALAFRYRVPGNIKKQLLVEILQAAKSGNENEVGRLLQSVKQNRKRKVRKIKAGKVLGLTSTPLRSPDHPDYVMADDYCPQQQPPYQWVAAEEEIINMEDQRIPQYEEFKQFLIKRRHREFQAYDTNNNQIQDEAVVDLRTATISSDVQTVPLDTNYNRSNIMAVNNVDSFVYQPNDHVEYQTLEDTSNIQGSVLLKKMLQAPAGANLGEIASPVIGGYRFWAMDQSQSNLLDNSDTLTAESDNQDSEDPDNNAEGYGLLGSIKGEYFLNEPTFGRNVDEIEQQIPTVLTTQIVNHYKYPTNIDMHQDYEKWTITNVMDVTNVNSASDVQSSKIFQSMYYDNMGPETLSRPMDDENLYQYRTADVQSYNPNQNLLMNPPEQSQYYNTNIPGAQSDNANYLQNLVKYNTEGSGEYYQSIHSSNANVHTYSSSTSASQTFSNNSQYNTDPYEYSCSRNQGNVPEGSGEYYQSIHSSNANVHTYNSSTSASQTFSNNSQYNTDPYEYSCSRNQGNVPVSETLEQEHSCGTIQTESNSSKNVSTIVRKTEANGLLDPFWPKKNSKIANPVLENVLNFLNTKRDLSKLDQTSCVYCHTAPVVTHTPVSADAICSQKEKFVAEYRQHSFSPHWLLYNDTSCGLRMVNLQAKHNDSVEEKRVPSTNSNPDLKRSDDENEDSIPEIWAQTKNYEAAEKDTNVGDGLNVVTDCLFSVINTEPLGEIDADIPNSQAQ